MTLRIRRILFYSLSVLFILLGTAAIFYSNGWRFDVETFEINKLGAMFFESIPKDAAITIDKNKFDFRSGILKSGTLVANLFPKNYTVKITKDGYQTWIKEVEVFPSLVTEIPPIVLLPENQELGEPLAEAIENFWAGPKHLVLYKDGQLEFSGQKILGQAVVQWSKSGDSVITKSAFSYFLTDLLRPTGALNLSLVFENLLANQGLKKVSIKKIAFDPGESKRFIVSTENGLYLLDTGKFKIETIFDSSVSVFAAEKNELIFSDGKELFIYNLALGSSGPLIEEEFKKIKDIQISPSGLFIGILEDGGSAYLFDRRSLKLEQVANNATHQLFSPDGEKLAIVSEKEIIIHPIPKSLAEENGLPGQGKTRGPAALNIWTINGSSLAWHKNSAYLFIKYPSSLYLLEANDLPPINFQVIDLENRKYEYRPSENAIYLFKEKGLYKLTLE
jgi:hypothetical protein